jgi:hypothetical protein
MLDYTFLRGYDKTPDFLYHDGITAYKMGHYELAEVRFQEALSRMPESAILHNKLGMALAQQGRSGNSLSKKGLPQFRKKSLAISNPFISPALLTAPIIIIGNQHFL